MEERIRSTRSSLAVFVGCCAMSFIGFALITNTSGLYFDAISRDLHVGRAKVSLTVSIRLICSAISMAAFSRFSHRIRLRPTLIGCIGICAVGFLLCSRAYALWQFYLAFAVMGLAYVIPITLMPPILLAAWFPAGGTFGNPASMLGFLVFPMVSAWFAIHFKSLQFTAITGKAWAKCGHGLAWLTRSLVVRGIGAPTVPRHDSPRHRQAAISIRRVFRSSHVPAA